MRSAGILLPVSSLPSLYGIGSFSESARRFVDLLERSDQSFWQILPLGPTGYGDSPYQAFSAFAGNPYYIDLDALIEEGLLERSEAECIDFGQGNPERVDYLKLYRGRFPLLRKACERSRFEEEEAYRQFYRDNAFWLDDYALFMAIKDSLGGVSWYEWPDPLRLRQFDSVLGKARQQGAADPVVWKDNLPVHTDLSGDIRFYCFVQYQFMKQWMDLKAYANSRGIRIIGDIPVYVSADSSDAWACGELFQFNEDHRPDAVAGCPPDAFSVDGQLWGNPLYDWAYHEKTQFSWWKKRIAHCLKLYDVVRIDHFRGFDEYYSIPAGAATAAGGHWEKGPGMRLFRALKENPAVTKESIIAEDLGFLTPSVMELVRETGFAGMKVIEFAFDSRDTGSGYLPHSYIPNTVVYTGTHDNQTLRAWYGELAPSDRRLADDYLGFTPETTPEERNRAFIRLAMESVSDTCVIPVQDYLALGSEARMNHPATMNGNWTWRLTDLSIDEDLIRWIRRITQITGRSRQT